MPNPSVLIFVLEPYSESSLKFYVIEQTDGTDFKTVYSKYATDDRPPLAKNPIYHEDSDNTELHGRFSVWSAGWPEIYCNGLALRGSDWDKDDNVTTYEFDSESDREYFIKAIEDAFEGNGYSRIRSNKEPYVYHYVKLNP